MAEPTIDDDLAELRSYAGKGPSASRLACGRVADEVIRLRAELDAAQLRSIEARNPGIDMDEVRRERSRG